MADAIQFSEPPLARFLFADTRPAWFWFIVRLSVGYEWVAAGWEKVWSSVWIGDRAGTAVQGFLLGALEKSGGQHPDVSSWYALDRYVLPALGTPWQRHPSVQ